MKAINEIKNVFFGLSDAAIGDLRFDNLRAPETLTNADIAGFLTDRVAETKKACREAKVQWKKEGKPDEGGSQLNYARAKADWLQTKEYRNTFNALRIPGPTFMTELDRVVARDGIAAMFDARDKQGKLVERIAKTLRVPVDLKVSHAKPNLVLNYQM